MFTDITGGHISPIKLIVVGDGRIGKTCLLKSFIYYTTGEYISKDFQNYNGSLDWEGTHVTLSLWDTLGQKDYENLRPLPYSEADILLLCFSIDNIHSYHNMTAKWQPEIKHQCPQTPYILVGTKTDLRYFKETTARASVLTHDKYVSKIMGKKLSKKIKAEKYLECSAKNMSGIIELFEEVVRLALNPPINPWMCEIF